MRGRVSGIFARAVRIIDEALPKDLPRFRDSTIVVLPSGQRRSVRGLLSLRDRIRVRAEWCEVCGEEHPQPFTSLCRGCENADRERAEYRARRRYGIAYREDY